MKKFVVICADSTAGVDSVTPFANEQEANAWLAEDARSTYEEMLNEDGEPDDGTYIEVHAGFARIDTDEISYQWSVWPLMI